MTQASEDLEVRKIITELAKLLSNGICDLCGLKELKKRNGKYQKGGSFVIHHHKYKKKNGVVIEKIHSDFKKLNSKGKLVPDKLAYHKYLKPIVKKEPKRFRNFHQKCHYAVEITTRWKPERRRKLFKLAEENYRNNYK